MSRRPLSGVRTAVPNLQEIANGGILLMMICSHEGSPGMRWRCQSARPFAPLGDIGLGQAFALAGRLTPPPPLAALSSWPVQSQGLPGMRKAPSRRFGAGNGLAGSWVCSSRRRAAWCAARASCLCCASVTAMPVIWGMVRARAAYPSNCSQRVLLESASQYTELKVGLPNGVAGAPVRATWCEFQEVPRGRRFYHRAS